MVAKSFVPWFVQHESRYKKELDELERAQLSYKVDDKEKEAGTLLIVVQFPYKGNTYSIEATYPAKYPYGGFQLVSEDIPEGLHKGTYNNLICYLENVEESWSSSNTLAKILLTQLPIVINAHEDGTSNPQKEALDASPPSSHIHYEVNECIRVPIHRIPSNCKYGTATLMHATISEVPYKINGILVNVESSKSKRLFKLTDKFAHQYSTLQMFENHHKCTGSIARSQNFHKIRWVKLPMHPEKLGSNILNEAIDIWPSIKNLQTNGLVDIVGLIFPEESSYKTVQDSWVFVKRYTIPNPQKGADDIVCWKNIRADILDEDVLRARVPKTGPLKGKRVTIVGCGSLGSTIALQLGRLGLKELILVDKDHVETGNLPRWVGGDDASGQTKVQYLSDRIMKSNPFIQVSGFRMDAVCNSKNPAEDVSYLDMCLETDLIIDATAAHTASHIITDLARQKSVCVIHATGTPGCYGGIVSRFEASDSFCWGCLLEGMTDESIPNPSSDMNNKDIQVRGCFHPTFTGTGFDMDHIGLMAVRLAVATLCRGVEGGYPDFDWNVGIVKLWDQETDMPIAPEWETFKAEKHVKCIKHG